MISVVTLCTYLNDSILKCVVGGNVGINVRIEKKIKKFLSE